MMIDEIKYEHLLGTEFNHGKQDCYTLIQQFYRDNFDISLRDYARPTKWWDRDMDLYSDNFRTEGFEVVDLHIRDWQPGDLIMMAIQTSVACHAGIWIGDNKILHHFLNRRSNIENYSGIWRNNTVFVLRHNEVKELKQRSITYDIMEDPRIKSKLGGVLDGKTS
ncbi:NlpC/P60 family protein [Kiloniella sp.]|uniref:NlpC/P60 family protein n=1 Tax=Kiloniella sp. TaxID=1938587 RepID=UPI003B020CF7